VEATKCTLLVHEGGRTEGNLPGEETKKSLDGSWWMDTYGLWMENTDVLKIEMITMCYSPMELVTMF
jgi:hypothetical protein